MLDIATLRDAIAFDCSCHVCPICDKVWAISHECWSQHNAKATAAVEKIAFAERDLDLLKLADTIDVFDIMEAANAHCACGESARIEAYANQYESVFEVQ